MNKILTYCLVILYFLSDTVIQSDTLSRRKVPLYAGNNSHEQIPESPRARGRERATSKRPMTANVALFDAGSGDLINALSTNHTAPPTVTCHFNTVKLPFPNKTLSGLPTPTNLLASVGTVDGWRPKSLVCTSRSQQTEISRIHAPHIDHVFTPYVVNANACTTEMRADALPVKPLFPFTSPILIKNRPSISPLLCTCKISGFSFLLFDDSVYSRRRQENTPEKSKSYHIMRRGIEYNF